MENGCQRREPGRWGGACLGRLWLVLVLMLLLSEAAGETSSVVTAGSLSARCV